MSTGNLPPSYPRDSRYSNPPRVVAETRIAVDRRRTQTSSSPVRPRTSTTSQGTSGQSSSSGGQGTSSSGQQGNSGSSLHKMNIGYITKPQ